MKYIKKGEWLSNSPDLSPMDFGINGIFKGILYAKKTSTLDGLKSAARRVWVDFPLAHCYNTMASWGKRVKNMIENKGFHMEK